MKTWEDVKKLYPVYLEKKVKVPKLRISAINNIERVIKINLPDLLISDYIFNNIRKENLKEKYEIWKGKPINGAESQAINDFYKLSI